MTELRALAGIMSPMARALMVWAGGGVCWLLFIVVDIMRGSLVWFYAMVCQRLMTSSTGQWSEPCIAVCIDALSTKGMMRCEHTK